MVFERHRTIARGAVAAAVSVLGTAAVSSAAVGSGEQTWSLAALRPPPLIDLAPAEPRHASPRAGQPPSRKADPETLSTAIETVGLSGDGWVWMSGRGTANAHLAIQVNGRAFGRAIVGTTGAWTLRRRFAVKSGHIEIELLAVPKQQSSGGGRFKLVDVVRLRLPKPKRPASPPDSPRVFAGLSQPIGSGAQPVGSTASRLSAARKPQGIRTASTLWPVALRDRRALPSPDARGVTLPPARSEPDVAQAADQLVVTGDGAARQRSQRAQANGPVNQWLRDSNTTYQREIVPRLATQGERAIEAARPRPRKADVPPPVRPPQSDAAESFPARALTWVELAKRSYAREVIPRLTGARPSGDGTVKKVELAPREVAEVERDPEVSGQASERAAIERRAAEARREREAAERRRLERERAAAAEAARIAAERSRRERAEREEAARIAEDGRRNAQAAMAEAERQRRAAEARERQLSEARKAAADRARARQEKAERERRAAEERQQREAERVRLAEARAAKEQAEREARERQRVAQLRLEAEKAKEEEKRQEVVRLELLRLEQQRRERQRAERARLEREQAELEQRARLNAMRERRDARRRADAMRRQFAQARERVQPDEKPDNGNVGWRMQPRAKVKVEKPEPEKPTRPWWWRREEPRRSATEERRVEPVVDRRRRGAGDGGPRRSGQDRPKIKTQRVAQRTRRRAERRRTRGVRRSRHKCHRRAGRRTKLPGRYIVARGDSLWRISRRHYRHGHRYRRIYRANRRKIRNPDLIYPCQRFYIPPAKRRWRR